MRATAFGFGTLARVEQIDAQIAELRLKKKRIAANAEKWETETDVAMTTRLRRNHIRLGNREARYRLNDEARKPAKNELTSLAYDVFALIANEWRESRAGFRGVPLRLKVMASGLGCSDRHLKRILTDLDSLGVIVRIKLDGKPTRYAIANPESKVYRDALLDTLYARISRLQHLAKIEAALPNLESARTIGLERFQDDGLPVPRWVPRPPPAVAPNRGIAQDI